MRKRKSNIKPNMRVVAGRIKNKKVECPPGEIRPMTSITKEALFNIIGDCTGLEMLDLFSGSGNIAIEAYSRGLEKADIIEMDHQKKPVIQKNLESAGFTGAKLIMGDALSYCRRITKKYSFIMADPPFPWKLKEALIEVIGNRGLLTDDGFLVVHVHKKEMLPLETEDLICYDERCYGINKLYFYEKKTTEKNSPNSED